MVGAEDVRMGGHWEIGIQGVEGHQTNVGGRRKHFLYGNNCHVRFNFNTLHVVRECRDTVLRHIWPV